MSHYICQVLRRGEIKLPVLLEDENSPELPPIHKMYQPLRQSIYAILFNVHHVNFNRKQGDEKIKALKKKAADLKKQEKVSPVTIKSLSLSRSWVRTRLSINLKRMAFPVSLEWFQIQLYPR